LRRHDDRKYDRLFVPVPLLDLSAHYLPIRDEILSTIARVCDSQQFIMGPEVEGLEREVAAHLEVTHAIGVSSGTDALLIALMALDVGPGDEVVTTPFSFFATAGSVVRVGARPVLADIDAATFNLDPAGVEAALTPRTKAIMPVHLFGQPADLAPIQAASERHNVPLIEDAAQAIGATYGGRRVGSFGAVGCFSFFPSKNLGAFGDAGLVTTMSDSIGHRVRLLRNHGMEPKYFHHVVGGNFRLDALQAAVLRVKLPRLPGWTQARQRNAQRYRALFEEARLTSIVQLPVEAPGRTHIYNQFVIQVPDRDGLRLHLERQRIGTEIYYPVPFHLQRCFASLGYARGAFPVAEAAASRVLALPIYGELSDAQQAEVVGAIRAFYHG
jgi:dTDP-4-amino-4,6-dideoxygalactose transaminase